MTIQPTSHAVTPATPSTLRVTGLDITVHLVAEDGTEHRQVISSAGWKLGTLEIDIDDKFPDSPAYGELPTIADLLAKPTRAISLRATLETP